MHTSYVKLRNKTQRLVRKTQTGRCVRCYVRKEEAERSGDRQKKMGSRGPPQSHPNSAAISKGYNFASTWEQVSFLNDYSPNHASISVFLSSFLALVTSISIDLVFSNCICIQFLSHHLNSSLLLTIKSHSATDQIWRCCLPRFDLIFEVNCVLQNAPLTEQQQFAIVSLSHAVSERPLPLKLVRFCHLHVIAILLNQFKCNSHL